MSENENLALQLKYLEEKLLKYQKKLEKRINADDTKTVNFKNASPEVIKECEANCDEIKDELEDL